MITIPDIEQFAGGYYIQTNDLIDLLEDIDEAIGELQSIVDTSDNNYEVHDAQATLREWNKMYSKEYAELEAVVRGVSSDETMIIEDKIDDYLEDMVNDCYSISELPAFIKVVIDFDMLKQDYTEVEFQGYNYFVRNV